MQFMVAIFRRPAAAPRARRLRLGLALVGLRWLAAAVVAGQALGHEAAAGDPAIRKLVGQAVDLRAGERRDLVLDDRGRLRLARGAGGHVAEGEFVSTASPLAAAPGWRLVWTEQWTAPQRWQKHSANPVYTPAMTGWSGLVNGVSIVPLADGRTYRMYYAGARGQGIGFAEASVADPVRWQDHGREVLTPRPGTWEGDRFSQPRVVPVTATHWRMYYTGWGVTSGSGSPWALGLAESFDAGLTWTRYQDEPVLDRGPPGSADDGGAVVPSLLHVNGRWLMWYTGVRATEAQRIHLCLAESDDGIRWRKHPRNPVIHDPDAAAVDRSVISRCCVRHDGGVFRMWYSCARPDYRIHYAESRDGIDWEPGPVEPVLGPSAGAGWDDKIVEYPEVQIVDGVFRLWFCGNGFGSVGYATARPETSVAVWFRTGPTAEPDARWTDWQVAAQGQTVPAAAAGHHVQVKARLRSNDPVQSPALDAIAFEPVPPSSPAEPVPISLDDLYRQDTPTELSLAPDGRRAAYVRSWAERGSLFMRQALWLAERPADSTADADAPPATKPVEPGQPDARRPVFSPDGQWIAFLSTRPFPDGSAACPPLPAWSEPATDIWLVPVDGGAAIPLAGPGKPYGRVFSDPFYGRLAFSPDGRRLAFVADDGTDPRTPEERAAGVTVVRDDQGEGYEGYGPASIWVADLAPDPAGCAATHVRRLTTDGFWYGDPQWLPDGTALVVHANRTGDGESVRYNNFNQNHDLWRIDVATGRLDQLTHGPGSQISPRVAPDGRRLVCLSAPRRGPHMDVFNLDVVDLVSRDGSAAAQSRVLRDFHSAERPLPCGVPAFPLPTECWLDERRFVIEAVDGLESSRRLFDADAAQGCSAADGPEAPPAARDRAAARRRLTPPGNAFLRDRLVAADETVRWRSFDGLEVDGLLARPPAGVARPPYPVVVYPHGGPHSRSRPGFNFTVQLLAAHGYAVFQPNFRGTWGYDRRFLDANRLDLGGGDSRDILTGIDQLVRDGIVDPRRQFLHGASYGGYLTCWLIGHTEQFRAAAPLNAVTDMNVMWGVGDLQSWTEWELGGRPWEVAERMRERSPLSYVHRVRTPTLILHSDHDRRCPLAMAQMFHRGLVETGVETELVIYHDERHVILQLPHQEDLHRRVLDWFARHDLPPAAAPR